MRLILLLVVQLNEAFPNFKERARRCLVFLCLVSDCRLVIHLPENGYQRMSLLVFFVGLLHIVWLTLAFRSLKTINQCLFFLFGPFLLAFLIFIRKLAHVWIERLDRSCFIIWLLISFAEDICKLRYVLLKSFYLFSLISFVHLVFKLLTGGTEFVAIHFKLGYRHLPLEEQLGTLWVSM
jgi:hypothetical protein